MNLQVLRDGIRWLADKPIPTILAGLVLALAMGIGTVAFSVVNAALLRPAPYPSADRIVAISNVRLHRAGIGGVSPRRFLDFKNNAQSFENVAAFRTANQTFVLTGSGEPRLIRGARVSKDFFRLLGSSPMLGRTFESEAEISGNVRTAILSYGLWCDLLACDQTSIGKSVVLDGESFIVIGVMPRSFKIYGDRPIDLWLPLFEPAEAAIVRGQADLHVLARLKKEVSLQKAQAEAAVLDRQLATQYPETDKDLSFHLSYWWPSISERARPALDILSGAVALVLLIACSSLAFVLLAKSFAREKEIAIRLACGASTLRLAGAFLVEGLLYGSLAGGVGTLLAFWGINLIVPLVPDSIYIPRLNETTMDRHVLAFSLALSILTGLTFGLISTFSAIRMQPLVYLGGGAGAVTAGTLRKRARTFLVTFQMAVAIILSVATVLMLRSFLLTTQVPLGFNPDSLLMTEISLSPALMRQPNTWRAYYQEVSDKLKSTPGVDSVAVVSPLFFGDELFAGTISSPASTNKTMVLIRYVTSGFSRTIGLSPHARPRLHGRRLLR
jgi:putative ABC transport system permease protein